MALAGCTDGDEGSNGETAGDADDTTEVEFILNPAESSVDIVEQYQPLFQYIESEVDVDIEPNRAADYSATLQSIRSGSGEIADISPSAAIAGREATDIIGMRIQFGAAQYFSLITTTMDSGIESIDDLGGEEVAFGATMSVSGTLVPLAYLSRQGYDIGDAPQSDAEDFQATISGDHDRAAEQMINNPDVGAAATGAFTTADRISQDQFDEMSEEFGEVSAEYPGAGEAIGDEHEELRLLAVSDPIPRAPLISRSDWEDPVREEIEDVILDVTEEDLQHGDDYDGEPLWFTGVEPAEFSDYDPIQDTMDELGLEFADLT
ncbi:phosphate/phosphite/phosphonate ABC transporter substrate-binding protein [Halorubrum gandharaense]